MARLRLTGSLEHMVKRATGTAVREQTAVAATPVLLDEITKRYGRRRGAVAALDRVSLSFAAGSFTAVLGVSGSGKSTLLQEALEQQGMSLS